MKLSVHYYKLLPKEYFIILCILFRFLIVELMRGGATPKVAATEAILRIAKYYPKFSGALIAVSKSGEFYAACHGISEFPFSIANFHTNTVRVLTAKCINY